MNSNLLNFQIIPSGFVSDSFLAKGISDFHEACTFIHNLPYGRTSMNENFELVFDENKGNCSSKHALLAKLAEENQQNQIELIMGIFLMNSETHPVLADFFEDKAYSLIPEACCYIRCNGFRYDFTSTDNNIDKITSKIIREQRIEPHQIGEWKLKIHQDYLGKWLKRHPDLKISLNEIWNERESCIRILEENY